MATRRREASDAGDAILEAAGRLLAEEGAHALTVRRIATEAGGSTMNVYSRFGGKDGVVEALFVEGFRRLGAALASPGTTDDPLADLMACGDAYRAFAEENPTLYGVMFEGAVADFEPSEAATSEAAATLLALAAKIQRVMDAGRFEPGDAFTVATSIWAVNHGLVSLERKHAGPPGVDWSVVHTMTLTAMMRGLAPLERRPPDGAGG